jgi:hypothetical protein
MNFKQSGRAINPDRISVLRGNPHYLIDKPLLPLAGEGGRRPDERK